MNEQEKAEQWIIIVSPYRCEFPKHLGEWISGDDSCGKYFDTKDKAIDHVISEHLHRRDILGTPR